MSAKARADMRKRHSAGSRRQQLVQKLFDRLLQLDGELSTVVERFQLRERGRLQALLAATNGEDAEAPEPTQAQAIEMLGLLNDLKLKPERGRTRDLVAIHATLKKLETIWLGK